MPTAVEIISRALRILAVLDPNETPEAEQTQGALVTLNAMGQRWQYNGLIEQWIDLENSTDVPSVGPNATDAMSYGLAMRLRPEYGIPVAEDVAAMAQQAIAALWRDRLVGDATGNTAGDIVYRALRVISGAGVANAPDNFNLSGALYALNAQARRWLRSGLIEQWSDATTPASSFPQLPEHKEVFSTALAISLASEYGVPVREEVVALASDGVAQLWRDRLEATGTGTVGDIIRRALRMIGVSGPRPDGLTLQGAVEALNGMCRRWEANGMAMGWNDVSGLSDDLPAPPEASEAIASNLAVTLSPEYGVNPSAVVVTMAQRGLDQLRRDVKVANPMVYERRGYGYDTRSDTYE